VILPGGLPIAAVFLSTPGFCAAENLLRNGDFSAGTGDTPDGWHRETWIDLPTTRLAWIKPSGGEPGAVSVDNGADNMARWVQHVHLSPGLYYVGAQVKTLGLAEPSNTGAMISLTGLGMSPENLQGNNNWTTASFYLKVGAGGGDAPIALGIGFFAGYSTGQALFRGASVVPVDELPPGQYLLIDLDKVNSHFGQGSQWPLALLLCPLMAAAVAGWIVLRPPPPSS